MNIYGIGGIPPVRAKRERLNNGRSLQVLVNPESEATINPGDGLKIVGNNAGQIVVDKITSLTDVAFGVAGDSLFKADPLNTNPLNLDDRVITAIQQDDMYLQYGANLSAGTKVQYNATGDKLVALTTGTCIGTLLRDVLLNELALTSVNISNV